MPSSHLPRTPCDNFFNDFPCDFGHRRWLRVAAYVFTLATGIVQFLLRGKSVRDCVEIVRKSCNVSHVSAVAVQSPQPPHGNRTEPVRGLCSATYDMSTGYGLTIFPNLSSFSLNQIIEAAEPVNPYKNLTAASCLRREASRGPHGKGDTGSVYTHRKPNVN